MQKPVVIIKSSLIAAIMVIFGSVALAQDVASTQAAAGAMEAVPTHFDAQYEDSGVKVYITKLFPQYQMKDGQMVIAQNIFMTDLLKTAGLPHDTRRIFHSVSDDSAEIVFSPIIAGTRAGIAGAASRENSSKFVNAIGAVLMFGAGRGLSGGGTSALSNLGGLKTVVSTGMLKSADFQDSKIDNSKSQGMQANEDDVIFVSKLEVRHSQSDNSMPDAMIFFVMPKEMKGEVMNGKHLTEYRYGANFSNVLSRAILRTANFSPENKAVADVAIQK